jgi:hypothetical protein
MSSIITVGTNSYNLIPLPTFPGVSQISLTMEDSVAVVQSPFVPSQVQTQTWPGADKWSLEFTLPKMSRQTAAPWRGFMGGLIGMQNVFQMGDPYCATPLGAANGAPVCDSTGVTNLICSNTLITSGWRPNTYVQLLVGDYLQIGYHLYQACANANSDSSGNAPISIWPSLRESPANGTAITLINTVGLWRLASNTRVWHNDFTRLAQISFKAAEVR